jgi:hypothetical protein
MRTTIFNVNKLAWKDVKLISDSETIFRFGSCVLPTYTK